MEIIQESCDQELGVIEFDTLRELRWKGQDWEGLENNYGVGDLTRTSKIVYLKYYGGISDTLNGCWAKRNTYSLNITWVVRS